MRRRLTAAVLALGVAGVSLFAAAPANASADLFTIKSRMNSKCLASNGDNVEVQTCGGGFVSHQLWRWDGKTLRNVANGHCLDVRNGEINAPVQDVGDCHGNANQRWFFENEYLRTDVNGQVLSIQNNGDPSEHAGINMRHPVNAVWQKWFTTSI